jgi:hypothetical protein
MRWLIARFDPLYIVLSAETCGAQRGRDSGGGANGVAQYWW